MYIKWTQYNGGLHTIQYGNHKLTQILNYIIIFMIVQRAILILQYYLYYLNITAALKI